MTIDFMLWLVSAAVLQRCPAFQATPSVDPSSCALYMRAGSYDATATFCQAGDGHYWLVTAYHCLVNQDSFELTVNSKGTVRSSDLAENKSLPMLFDVSSDLA